VLLWLVAVVATVALAAFQRMTGPSYPVRDSVTLAGQEMAVKLLRSHAGSGGLPVVVPAPADITGSVIWRRYPTEQPWQTLLLERSGDNLATEIPHQPTAGKVEYRVVLEQGGEQVSFPGSGSVVARFRSSVPAWILIPHIVAMFTSMLVATRAVLEVLRPCSQRSRGLVLTAMVLLVFGGLILGPLVQKYAFGAFWTGWPLGSDLTDTKTLIAFLAWLPATVLALSRRSTRVAVILGWVVMMTVFLVPHSLHGSQIDWDQPVETGITTGP
jgi:hypothetical protein